MLLIRFLVLLAVFRISKLVLFSVHDTLSILLNNHISIASMDVDLSVPDMKYSVLYCAVFHCRPTLNFVFCNTCRHLGFTVEACTSRTLPYFNICNSTTTFTQEEDASKKARHQSESH